MQGDIAIGMSEHAAVMGNADTAEPDMVARREGVDIIAAGDADQQVGHGGWLHGEILRVGQLHIGRVAGEDRDGMACPFEQGGIIGEALLVGRRRSGMSR